MGTKGAKRVLKIYKMEADFDRFLTFTGYISCGDICYFVI